MGRERPERSPREYFCADILRLPPGETEPDHYTLLGLAFFEQDHGTIVRAAMERIGLLESCQADPRPGHQKAVGDLLAEVRQAQITLLDPKRRKAYDATLTGGEDGGAPQEEEQQDDEVELVPGTMVAGRYRVLGERRRGGFGVVYDALDFNLRTRVELSVLRPRLSQGHRSRRRAERAARAAALLDHPNILRVDEVGDAEGLLFTRSRRTEGQSLLEVIEATPRMRLEPDQVRSITRQVAEALAFAHGQEVTHGDLRPHNVFVGGDGRVHVGDFRISRTVLNELGEPAPRTRAPEDEDSEAGDLFSLGCIAYQMLAGMPPFAADTTHYVPRPLPDDVTEDLEVLVTRLLARDPRQRPPGAAEVAARLAPRVRLKRLPLLVSVMLVLIVALLAALIGSGSEEQVAPGMSDSERGWQLIAGKRYDEAIATLRKARQKRPDDRMLHAPLAGALDRKAALLEDKGDLWNAQAMLEEAQELAPEKERENALRRVRQAAIAILQRLRFEVPQVSAAPAVTANLGARFRGTVEIAGQSVRPAEGVARLELKLPDGLHKVRYALVDRAGNRSEGELTTIVDTRPPTIEILEPQDGSLFRKGLITVKVRVEDANPPGTVLVRGRTVKLASGVAADTFGLEDGAHVIEAVVKDRAGHEAKASIKVSVDSTAPDLSVAADRIVTTDGRATIRGAVSSTGARVTVDGGRVELAEDGSFGAEVRLARDGFVSVEATGSTGLKRVVNVAIVIDHDPPELGVAWARRDKKGVLLYGAREMDGGGVRLPLRARDKTRVTFEPADGKLDGDAWVVEAYEGARKVSLVATDEAGNTQELVLSVEGHRSTPTLIVKSATKPVTNDDEAVLEIEADGTLYVQDKETQPGRVKLPLAEGRVEIVVRAVDHYGNESTWTRSLVVDRTPPTITLHGTLERGVGRQELRFDADEVLQTLTCFGKTIQVGGKTARVQADLKVGRRRVAVVAKDRAGNATKSSFTLRIVNRVLVLDGSSALRVDGLGQLAEFTIECWVRGVEATGRSLVLARSARSAGFGIFWSREDRGLPYAALVVRESGFTTLPVRKGWRWERWTHLALCFDGHRARFFVNGSLHHFVSTGNPLVPSRASLLIGAGPDSLGRARYFFKGALDELRLSKVARYPRAFTPARYHREDKNTLLLLRFDTMAGDRFADTSGHNRHAVRVGRPVLKEESR